MLKLQEDYAASVAQGCFGDSAGHNLVLLYSAANKLEYHYVLMLFGFTIIYHL